MARNWTEAQKAAIYTQGKNLLVSAAAGSGKTAVLTERIIQSLLPVEDPADISRILVVTFTKAAASELRSRIFSAISDALAQNPSNRHLYDQLIRLGTAKISTIDSYYLSLVEEHTEVLGLPSSFCIADFAEEDILAREIMNDCITDAYDQETEEFSRFTECFTSLRTTSRLCDVLLQLYSHLQSCPEGIHFLQKNAMQIEKQADVNFFETTYGSVIREELIAALSFERAALFAAIQYMENDTIFGAAMMNSYGSSFHHDLKTCNALLEEIDRGDYEKCAEILRTYAPLRAKPLAKEQTTDQMENWKGVRKKFATRLSTIQKKYFATTSEGIRQTVLETARITRMLHRIITQFDQRYWEEKTNRGICTLSDVRRLVLQLLVDENGAPTPYAKEISKRYDAIYIDEYQDVDRVQDLIFRSISNGHNRFMVGDIKQSIYQFRGADPSVFADYRGTYPKHDSKRGQTSEQVMVLMSENFRCDKPVIHFTNLIFDYLFSICRESIHYQKADKLRYSKNGGKAHGNETAVEITLLGNKIYDCDIPADGEAPPEETNAQIETRYIAERIKDLVYRGKKEDGSRIRFGDIAILFRSKTVLPLLTATLRKNNIPFVGGEERSYFENPDIQLMLCLLHTIDNPQRDIYLTGLLRSPLFGFTLDDLIQIRKKMPAAYSLFDCVEAYARVKDPIGRKATEFCNTLHAWREHSLILTVDRLLEFLLQDDRLIACSLPSSPNVVRLYEYARKFEQGTFRGLYQFMEYIRRMIEEGATIENDSNEISQDAVNLMTIHHSKGLEFPVCILCNANKQFNKEESKESLVFDNDLGVGMKIADGSGFARVNTLIRESILLKHQKMQIEEEMRVLYVAMTRAREKLIITASPSSTMESMMATAETRKSFSSLHTLMQCNSYLDWILCAVCDHPQTKHFTLAGLFPDDVIDSEPYADEDWEELLTKEDDKENEEKDWRQALRYEYPYAALSRIPSKIAISKLSPDVLDEVRDTALFAAPSSREIPAFFRQEEGEQTNLRARRGTATHQFLQFCRFDRAQKQGVGKEIACLIQEGFLPATAEKELYTEELERFFSSALYQKITQAKKMIREQRFNIFLPSAYFTENAERRAQFAEEKLAVQGVIDLILIDADGRITLVDYKTDRITEEQRSSTQALQQVMQERHGLQLSYYALALESILGKPCDEILIYSTDASRCVPLHVAIRPLYQEPI